MSDPRYTDSRYDDPRISDPVYRRNRSVGGMWGWIAGIVVVALIAFFLIAGGNGVNKNTASNGPAPATSGSVNTPPSTTGMGSTSPKPAPAAPAPARPTAPGTP